MSPDEFDFAARLVREKSGLVLTRDKGCLFENRLMPVVRGRGFKSLSELVGALRAGNTELQMEVVDAMLAKDTGFFRDWKPFVHLRDVVLPNIYVARGTKRTLRILSAGASMGQEAYSAAIWLHESKPFKGWNMDIVGIDVSVPALAAATRGVYSQFDVQRGLPVRTLLQHFTKEEDSWTLGPGVRSMVRFQTWNLLDDLFPLGRFDVILRRNVLIYFDLQTKLDVLQKISRLLSEDGVLYLGLNETVTGVSGSFRAVDSALGIYAAHRPDRPVSLSLSLALKA